MIADINRVIPFILMSNQVLSSRRYLFNEDWFLAASESPRVAVVVIVVCQFLGLIWQAIVVCIFEVQASSLRSKMRSTGRVYHKGGLSPAWSQGSNLPDQYIGQPTLNIREVWSLLSLFSQRVVTSFSCPKYLKLTWVHLFSNIVQTSS